MRKCNKIFVSAKESGKHHAASISVEAALCSAVLSFLFFFLISLLQYVYVYYAAARASVSAAELFSCYSSVFYKSGLTSLSNSVKYKLLRTTGMLEDTSLAPVVSAAETAFDLIDDAVCEAILKELIRSELEKEEGRASQWFPVAPVSLTGSSFFRNGNEFTMLVRCRSKLLFPLPWMKGYDVRICVKGNCWLSGESTGYTIEDIQVWELSNLKRGKVIETVFGANLPDTFPVLDIYNQTDRSATMIISLDHTAKTYGKKGNLSAEIKRSADRLIQFESGSAGSYTVNASDILQKKLLIVIPKNLLTTAQSKELMEAMLYCQSAGIEVSIETYQLSNG